MSMTKNQTQEIFGLHLNVFTLDNFLEIFSVKEKFMHSSYLQIAELIY